MSESRAFAAVLAAALVVPTLAAAREGGGRPSRATVMSAMGQTATEVRVLAAGPGSSVDAASARDVCTNVPDCEAAAAIAATVDDPAGPAGGQAETSIAVDDSGQHVVVGFNDTRGFSLNPVSVSGFMYSDDGGRTFVDGGQLPAPATATIGTSAFPQVFGDPEVKHLGGCNFVYASILLTVKEYLPAKPVAVQTLSVHRSRDCGHTWEGPFEVTAATNPNDFVYSDGNAVDAADKEFLDVDPATGRVLLSWTNFTHPAVAPGGVQIATTYSDDLLTAETPTWSHFSVVSAMEADGQSSVPRFAPDGSAYVAWRRFPYPGTFSGFGNVIAVARSDDRGATWGAPVETSAEFFTMDQVLGNDRVNTSPTLAVDWSRTRARGTIYLAYSSNDSGDGADVVFQASTDRGATWSAARPLNSRPGADRAQWFPWLTADRTSGRLFGFWYDQGVADTGDLTQVAYTFSDDAGAHWAAPAMLSPRTFRAGWGNDTGQPNLGDYNQAVVQRGKLYASFAVTARPPAGFVDGQPSTGMTVPDTVVMIVPNDEKRLGAAPVDLTAVDAFDLGAGGHNGYIDPGESVGLKLTLRNSATNRLFAATLTAVTGQLTSPTPGVRITSPLSTWPDLAPGASAANRVPFVLFTSPGFVPGTPIELVLQVQAGGGVRPAVQRWTLLTGTPIATTIFTEDFEKPSLAAGGWATAHGGGANVVPWTLLAGTPEAPVFCGQTSGVAFHQNANDGAGKSPTRWERLISPGITVPAASEYITVDFDVCYDTEEDPGFRVLAYDGFFLRVTDVTPGRTLRSVLAEAYEDELTTGSLLHYPRHLPRSSNRAYFEDMSAWAGDSGGVRHVHMRLPGMAGSVFQLRFEFTQDGAGTCADLRPGHACGVSVDNIVVRSVTSAP